MSVTLNDLERSKCIMQTPLTKKKLFNSSPRRVSSKSFYDNGLYKSENYLFYLRTSTDRIAKIQVILIRTTDNLQTIEKRYLNLSACELTVADGVGKGSGIGESRKSGVVGGDDAVVFVWVAGDGGQHVEVDPRASGYRHERNADTSSF